MERPGDLSELQAVQAEFDDATERLAEVATRREELILRALRQGRSNRDVAKEAKVSREAIRRIAAGRAAAMTIHGETWDITEPQTRHYAEIGQGFEIERYPRDRELLGFERPAPWQATAGDIGRELQAIVDGKRTEPIDLSSDERQYAFCQLTRISYIDQMTNLGRLSNFLFEKFGTEARY